MQIFIGADHAGFELKDKIREHIKSLGHEVLDLGTFSETSVDYPDVAREVCEKVIEHADSLGILICGTGIGMSMAANKMHGIRAALAHDANTAHLSRQHNNANVLALGARVLSEAVAQEAVDAFLSTEFEGGRHEARVAKINALES